MRDRHSGVDAVQFSTASIARKLVERRKEAGLAQGEVARKAKIRQETLSRLEHGHGNPTVDIVSRIAVAIEQLDKRSIARKLPVVETRRKVIQVELNNSDLNALEDLLYCILTPKERRLAEEKAKRIWNALVVAWDEPEKLMRKIK
jgi:transcriptional regulator with XRE-family HTH domain